MKAIILAAGIGKRLSGAHHQPKCLLEIGGLTLLERHLDCLHRAGVDEVTLCLGYNTEPIVESLANAPLLIHYNPLFELGSVVSLWSARQTLMSGEDVIVMDADVLYDPEILRRLVSTSKANCFLIDRDFVPGDEPVKICVRDCQIVEFGKHIDASLSYNHNGESVGFFKFDAGTSLRLANLLSAYIADGRRELPHEEALRELALDDPDAIGIEDVTGLPWIEIDFPEDIARAQEEILPRINGAR